MHQTCAQFLHTKHWTQSFPIDIAQYRVTHKVATVTRLTVHSCCRFISLTFAFWFEPDFLSIASLFTFPFPGIFFLYIDGIIFHFPFLSYRLSFPFLFFWGSYFFLGFKGFVKYGKKLLRSMCKSGISAKILDFPNWSWDI